MPKVIGTMLQHSKHILRPSWRAFRRLMATIQRSRLRQPAWIEDLKRMKGGKTFETIFDVGASRGQTSQVFYDCFPSAHVYAFEPIPEVACSAKERHAANARVTVECLALDEFTTKRVLHINAYSETSSLLPSETIRAGRAYLETREEVKIRTLPLDAYCRTNSIASIDLLKIDVQGAELQVLRGAKTMLETTGSVFAEVLFESYYQNQTNAFEIDGWLQQHGFWFYRYYDFDYADDGRLLQANGLWLKAALFPRNNRPLDAWEQRLNSAISTPPSQPDGDISQLQ